MSIRGAYLSVTNLQTGYVLVVCLNTVITSKSVKLNAMRKVLNVGESLPVVGVAVCLLGLPLVSLCDLALDQENVTQEDNVTFSASI